MRQIVLVGLGCAVAAALGVTTRLLLPAPAPPALVAAMERGGGQPLQEAVLAFAGRALPPQIEEGSAAVEAPPAPVRPAEDIGDRLLREAAAIIGPADGRELLVRRQGEVERLRTGSPYAEGWAVAQIEGSAVTLAKGRTRRVVSLFAATESADAPESPASSPARTGRTFLARPPRT